MDFSGKKVLVIGLARSGLGAIKVLSSLGADITLSESKPKEEIREAEMLEKAGVKITGQSMDVFEEKYDLAIKNPGVPYRAPMILKLEENGVPVITEIELAYQVSKPQHFAAITGSNGKTTTSTLLYEILHKAYGEKAHLCGNIGIALCEMVMDYNLMQEEGHYFALEVSNFQLVNIDKFRPEVATIINLSPDHVDFMGSLDNYYKSKTEVYRNMRGDDEFILNTDDATLLEYTERYPVSCKVNSFSLDRQDTDSFVKDGFIYIKGEKVMPVSVIKLVGKHNLQNVMVAVSAAKALGVSNEIITEAVSEFKGVEHRIEFVRELGGVRYYNDSKGTNPDATITAVRSFEKGVILLVGGFEKGLSMDELKKNLGSVRKVIGYGVCGPRLVKELVGDDGILVENLVQAVDEAYKIAEPGDTVLLSPTTSSFDQYSGFEERGDHFKQIVNSL
ncbi:MAG: UDP-N-acetylmuramoyl-L-alanine--D-glutamate ligase [Clostridia bacterium]|nr:UDP-N-acetylmuramoyl-L-alanine--D-glutamate ligase [Clostridia bacterium]MBR6702026.1 UDP-N-acetylmuramoyl-L-alanine--D-glutamate ligase [Clostridia bacterium]